MANVEGSVWIDAPAADLFALSQDYTLRRAWDPFVRDLRLLGGASEAGLGVHTWVRAWTGLTMEVVFTSFRPPVSVAMRMVRGPRFLGRFAGCWLFKPQAAGALVTFRYGFSVAPLWPRRMLEPFIAWLFRRDIRARLEGLKRGAEKDGLLELLRQPCKGKPEA